MMETLLPIARALLDALDPLRYAIEDRSGARFQTLVHELGWDIEAGDWFASLPLVTSIGSLLTQAVELRASLENPQGNQTATIVVQALELTQDLRIELNNLASTLPTGSSVPTVLKQQSFWLELAGDLPEYLLVQWLAANHSILHALLNLVGVIVPVPVGGSDGRRAITIDELRLSRLMELLQNPTEILAEEVGWTRSGGASEFTQEKAQAFMEKIALLAASANMHIRSDQIRSALVDNGQILTPNNPLLNTVRELDISIVRGFIPIENAAAFTEHGVLLVPVPEDPGGNKVAGLFLANLTWGTAVTEVELSDTWKLKISSSADASGELGITLIPGRSPEPKTSGGANGELEFVISNRPGTGPWLPIGAPESTRIEVDNIELSTMLQTDGGSPDVEIRACSVLAGETPGIAFVINPLGGDSFISGLLGSPAITAGGDVSITWSAQRGLVVEGAAGFALEIPLDKEIGPLYLSRLLLNLLVGSEGVRGDVGVTAVVSLGPVAFTVDNVGFSIELLPAENGGTGARIGDMVLTTNFKPPDGVGLAIDAGPVSGGGFLYIVPETGEYNGVLDLDLFSIGISAVGLIDTKLPGGGWSMFLALFIDLPSIPLGFGFTLNGVGGVAGINRTLDVDGLRSAIRAGTLDSVLFPEDPIADAPIIIDTFKDIFPSAEGRYVFGPVIQIGWGSPTLIEAEIGVVVSLPDPITIAVLGSVTSILPTDDTDMVALHLEVAGIIDMASASLSIDASLHGSHIAGFPLSGDMALRSAFGDAPSFLMALGGSHPAFDRPAGFPDIERLSLAINAGSLIDIRFDCYFAITSNSLHFGAAFELTAEVEGFGINGGAEFDALITFSPFSLRTGLGYHISVKAAGVDLMAVWLDMTLSGPNPWHVVGSATLTILGIDNTIPLDKTIGSKKHEELPDSVDVLNLLRDALELPDAWSIGAGGGQGVVLSATAPLANELVVTPDGTLGVTQKIVPLDITIDKSDPWQVTGGYDRFDLETGESGMTSTGNMTEWFAVSSYVDLKPSERLSAPSFEQLKSGITFGGGDPTAGKVLEGTLDFDQSIRDPKMREENEKLADTYNVKDDPRKGSLVDRFTGQAASGFSIAAEDIPKVVKPGYAVTNRVTGEVVARSNRWTVSRASTAGRKKSTVVVPTWEIES